MQFYTVCFQAFIQAVKQVEGTHPLHVQYGLPDDEHKMFETCRRQEELNKTLIGKVHFVC